jgi:hypothetical protein
MVALALGGGVVLLACIGVLLARMARVIVVVVLWSLWAVCLRWFCAARVRVVVVGVVVSMGAWPLCA